jgi:hypothetical protein
MAFTFKLERERERERERRLNNPPNPFWGHILLHTYMCTQILPLISN